VAKDDRFSQDILPLVRRLPGLVRVPLTRQMLSQDPRDHTRLRKLVSQAFTPRRIERLRDYALPIPRRCRAAHEVDSGFAFCGIIRDTFHAHRHRLPAVRSLCLI